VTRRIPQVADGVLHVLDPSGGSGIAVASPSWIAWLTDPATRSFSFQGPSCRYTARKEYRSRGGEYWIAYRKQGGKLHKAYLGKAEDVTLARLEDVAAVMADRGGEVVASPRSDEASGDEGHSRRVDAASTDSHTTADDQLRERRGHSTSANPLLMTKLAVPSTRVSLVPRPRLSERLEEGLGPQLILVSAPAGFGKSTLLGTWASELSGSGRPMAWYSLDSGDNDPAQFWRYFFTAIDLLQPGSGKTALALLGSPQPPPIEAILTTLLNELVDLSTNAVLVVDDYHLIESQTIHEALTFFIDHLPPRMHLVIATRMDPPLPLPRMRARGEMTELRAADLRFTPEEAATFLNQVMGLELSAEDTAELEGRTEGWIAGLQMAALAMRDHADIPGFIAAFAGSNRYVLDYLAEEVLARQPEELQTFLLETSILDRMSASLCNAVTGRADGQTALERLEHANLFVIPLDDERHWYRYHHLFVEVLRQRLRQERPDLVSVLHRRACGWFERQGLVGEAINHALAAQDWDRAVRLIESNGVTVVLNQQVQTMLGWIDRVPEELTRERPALCTIRALALVLFNRPDAAEASLQEAERYLGANPATDQARTILGRAAVIRAAIARSSGDLERCVAMGRRALELLPETEFIGRAAARTNAALAYQVSGNVAPANERALEEATASFRASGAQVMLLRSIDFLARLRTLQGRLRAAAATYEESAQVAAGRDGLRGTVNSAAYYVGLGDIHREWNDLDFAESHLRRSIDLFTGTLSVDAEVVTHGYSSLARLQQARGRHADARATLEEFADLARQRDFFPLLVARGEAAQVRLDLMQDDLPSAVSWAEGSELSVVDAELSYPREAEYLVLARVLIAQGQNDEIGSYLDDALDLLDRLLGAAEGGGRIGSVIEILVLRAVALQAQHESSKALAALERALVLVQPEGYVRVFVDEGAPMAVLLSEFFKAQSKGPRDAQQRPLHSYVRRLLAAFESPHTSTEPPSPGGFVQRQDQPLFDPPTAREQEVLELIAEGLSNQEIADQLFIEVGTVKGYVHSLLRKLEVDSRTKAVARARELHLVFEQ
jgi:LuxR family transcriptional regulator, maltose regulon positive regulatory protein